MDTYLFEPVGSTNGSGREEEISNCNQYSSLKYGSQIQFIKMAPGKNKGKGMSPASNGNNTEIKASIMVFSLISK